MMMMMMILFTTAESIQQACPLKLWVVLLTGFLLNTPNPIELHGAISSALDTLHQQGMTSNNIFVAGHSLGGQLISLIGQQAGQQYFNFLKRLYKILLQT